MAPVYHALARIDRIEPVVLLTGQHREQLAQALALFDIPVADNLDVMTERQRLPELAARIVPRAAAALAARRPDYVLVHGDTLTTFAVAWAAFLERIPVGHVEAGLRSGSL
ncbi:MAG TPA: UDP-N-acetylglucosamine 2-epimerase, partial [Limnochordia bacterium]